MSEILDRLAKCEQVTDWLSKSDPRLEIASGEPAPNDGGGIREGWWESIKDWPQLATEIKRILVPREIGSRVMAKVDGTEDWSLVMLDFETLDDWSSCFPINEDSQIFVHDRTRAWAAVGLCEDTFALAVFGRETRKRNVQSIVQPVIEEVFEKLI